MLCINAMYTSDRFLLTCNGQYPQGDMQYCPEADAARKVALDVKYVSHGNKCVRCGPSYVRLKVNLMINTAKFILTT